MSEYCHIQCLEKRGRESFTKKQCDRIDERIGVFEKAGRIFLNSNGFEGFAVLSKPTLAAAILDYFADVQRLKDFHNSISLINEDKIIAYECAWILKRRPFQVLCDDVKFIHINEFFIAEIIMNHLVGDFKDSKKYPEVSKSTELREFHKLLSLYLICCPADAQALELVIVAFKTALEVSKVGGKASSKSFFKSECNRLDESIGGFEEACQDFLASNGFNDSSVRLNRSTLKTAILEYSVDVQEQRNIYDSSLPINKDKIIAYGCAGILRRKPIQFLCDDIRFIHINEKFVANVIMNHLISNFSDEASRCTELEEFYKHLLYHLIYRPTEASSLEFMTVAFKTALAVSRINGKLSN